MKKQMIALMAFFLWTLTGCSELPDPRPMFHPVKPPLHKIKKCGTLKYEKKAGKVILDYRQAKCLSKALKQCGQDRKLLIIANRTNTEQMEAYGAD